ncbi:unnamed protein product [Rodentolepis nana]|uniref:Transmembrane protein n=1 Tax=Rodentolepis nana TaxID=102285 RepID=A0A0R3TPC0_RODNA|nr:unnamed protein product [Rodentolepis nana]
MTTSSFLLSSQRLLHRHRLLSRFFYYRPASSYQVNVYSVGSYGNRLASSYQVNVFSVAFSYQVNVYSVGFYDYRPTSSYQFNIFPVGSSDYRLASSHQVNVFSVGPNDYVNIFSDGRCTLTPSELIAVDADGGECKELEEIGSAQSASCSKEGVPEVVSQDVGGTYKLPLSFLLRIPVCVLKLNFLGLTSISVLVYLSKESLILSW